MATTNTKPEVIRDDLYRVVYETKSFLIFTWYKKLYSERISSDIFIKADEYIGDVYLNGIKIASYPLPL